MFFLMSSKTFCDDCEQEVNNRKLVKFWFNYGHPLNRMEFCYSCFSRHWKPIRKKFSLNKKVDTD